MKINTILFRPTWAAAKGIMADINFIKRLFEYDKEHIKEETLKKIKKYIEHKDFVPAVKISKRLLNKTFTVFSYLKMLLLFGFRNLKKCLK